MAAKKLEVPKVVTIRRKYWATPTKRAPAALRTKDGTMCCLGFVCHAAGVPHDKLRRKQLPHELKNNPLAGKGEFCIAAAGINDDWTISNKEREKELQRLFAKHKICKLRFVP